jgi:hypothetical protein
MQHQQFLLTFRNSTLLNAARQLGPLTPLLKANQSLAIVSPRALGAACCRGHPPVSNYSMGHSSPVSSRRQRGLSNGVTVYRAPLSPEQTK